MFVPLRACGCCFVATAPASGNPIPVGMARTGNRGSFQKRGRAKWGLLLEIARVRCVNWLRKRLCFSFVVDVSCAYALLAIDGQGFQSSEEAGCACQAREGGQQASGRRWSGRKGVSHRCQRSEGVLPHLQSGRVSCASLDRLSSLLLRVTLSSRDMWITSIPRTLLPIASLNVRSCCSLFLSSVCSNAY